MTDWLDVADITPRIAYTAAAQTVFVVPFVFFADTELKVYQNGTLLTLTTHYTVSGAEDENGGTVTLLTVTTIGDTILITRHLTIEQTTHIPPSGPLDIAAVNIQISKIIAMLQEQADGQLRSLRLPDSADVVDGLQTTAPVAGEFLKWNATENGVESTAVIVPDGSYAIATQSEAVAGTRNDVLMTPLRSRQATVNSATGIQAWDNGVPGDGSDQTVALQALINAAPSSACNIYLRGAVNFSTLDLHLRNHLVFYNGNGSSVSAVKASLNSTAGAIGVGVPAINCRRTNNVSFYGINIISTNAAFNGILLDYGGLTPIAGQESARMVLNDCFIVTNAAAQVGLNLYGATNGTFTSVGPQGPGRGIQLQVAAGSSICNNHIFNSCTFTPGAQYPVYGSGEGLTFIGCSWQQGTDGLGRGWQSHGSTHPFKGVAFIGCTFYDPSVAGGEWLNPIWGNGFTVIGCRMAGIAGSYAIDIGGGVGADPQEGGVRGFNISGNFFDGFSAAITFSGTIAAKSNPRGGIIGGNSVTVGSLNTSEAQCEQLVFLPNSIYSAPNALGSHFALVGLPSFANNAAAIVGGLGVGQTWRDASNFVRIV